jgi:hypothetical protein
MKVKIAAAVERESPLSAAEFISGFGVSGLSV